MIILAALLALSCVNALAAAPPDAETAKNLAQVIEKMRSGVTTNNAEYQIIRKDEDKSIPALLNLMENPGKCHLGFVTLSINGFQDYHLKNHISAKNLALIQRRAIGFLSSQNAETRVEAIKLLWTYPSASAVAPLKKFVRGAAPVHQRLRAMQALVAQLTSPTSLDAEKAFFIALSGDSDYAVSSAAHKILADTYKDPAEIRAQAKAANTEYGSVAAATKALATGNQWMMSKAAEELVRDGVSALPALATLAGEAENPEVRTTAMGAIRTLISDPANQTKEAVAALRDCLHHDKSQFYGCAENLAIIDLPEAKDALVDCATTPGEQRFGCLRAIAPSVSGPSLERIKKLLTDKDPQVPPMAAYILAQNGDASGLGVLRAEVAAISSKKSIGDSPEGRAISFNAAHVVDSFAYIGEENDLEALKKMRVPSKHHQRDIERRLVSVARGIDLRTKHGDTKGQIAYLKQQFEQSGDGYSIYWLNRLMGDRATAEYLLPFARRASEKQEPANMAAQSHLMSSGWIDFQDMMTKQGRFSLRDRPIRPR